MEKKGRRQASTSANKKANEAPGVQLVRLRSRKAMEDQKQALSLDRKFKAETEIAHVARKGKQGRQRDLKKKNHPETLLGKRTAAEEATPATARPIVEDNSEGYYGITNVINDFESKQLNDCKFFELVKMFDSPKEEKKLLAFYTLYQQLAAESDSSNGAGNQDGGVANLLAKAGNGSSFLTALLAGSMAKQNSKKKTGATLREKIFQEGINKKILALVAERLDFLRA